MVEWFDDLKVGMKFRSEKVTVSREDIIRFASEFDPQPFHTDEEAAKGTILNGLAASGWHTAAIAMRLAFDVRSRRRRSQMDEAGAARRHASSRRRGDRAGAVEVEAAGRSSREVD